MEREQSLNNINSYGFDLPATMQLSRVGRKIDTWERTQELVEKAKLDREEWHKKIMKKE